MRRIIFKYFLAWFPMVVIAIVNGIAREALYKNLLGDFAAHQFSTITAIILIGIYVWFITKLWNIPSKKAAWVTGVMWLGMTIIFEFGFGHYVMNNPWENLLADYNILKGNTWILLLLFITSAPVLFYRNSFKKEEVKHETMV